MSEAQQEPKTAAAVAAETQAKSEFARLLDRSISVGEGGIEIKSLEDLRRLSTYIVESGLAPKGDTVAAVAMKIQAGFEIGFTPMRSLAVLTAINGRVGIMGDAAKALIRSKKAIKAGTDFDEAIAGTGDQKTATVTAWRAGADAPVTRSFSIADAKLARLIASDTKAESPWLKYPERMLKYRALGFLVRDVFSDVLMGLYVMEELVGMPVREAVVERTPPTAADPLLESVTRTAAGGVA